MDRDQALAILRAEAEAQNRARIEGRPVDSSDLDEVIGWLEGLDLPAPAWTCQHGRIGVAHSPGPPWDCAIGQRRGESCAWRPMELAR